MAKGFVKHTGYLTHIDKVVSHTKYVGFRSSEMNEKGAFFSKDEDKTDYKAFIKRIETHKALQHSKSIKAQKLVFSLKELDYNAYCRSGKDYKDLVRRTLAIYEDRHGLKLDWIANTHAKKDHPHCHVIIKGVSDVKDSGGRYKRVKFTTDHYKELREIFEKEFYKDVQYRPDELEKTLLDKMQQNIIMKDIAKGFRAVASDIARDAEREQKKAEFERQRDIELQTQTDKNKKGKER